MHTLHLISCLQSMRAYELIIDLGTKPHPVVVALRRLWLAVDLSLHAPKQQRFGKRQLVALSMFITRNTRCDAHLEIFSTTTMPMPIPLLGPIRSTEEEGAGGPLTILETCDNIKTEGMEQHSNPPLPMFVIVSHIAIFFAERNNSE